MRRAKDYLLLYLKGMSMGAADVIPGASGGTIAFITGIYEELIRSINAVDTEALRLLFKLRFADFWKKINGNFLVVLLAGVVTSMLIVAKLMIYVMQEHSIKVWAFLFGVVLIASLLALRVIRKWNGAVIFALAGGIIASYFVTRISPFPTPNATWFMLVAGGVTGLVMLVPGMSLSYTLLLFRKFAFFSIAFVTLRITVLLAFIAGCIAGIWCFSRFLGFILKNYHSATVALLAGFMLGSLNNVWPWRQVLEYVTNREGQQIPVVDKSVLPWNYLEITGKDPQVFQAILMMALGVFIVVLFEKIAERLKTKI